jgi:hypothetical protein
MDCFLEIWPQRSFDAVIWCLHYATLLTDSAMGIINLMSMKAPGPPWVSSVCSKLDTRSDMLRPACRPPGMRAVLSLAAY